jgi:hypothetical protein
MCVSCCIAGVETKVCRYTLCGLWFILLQIVQSRSGAHPASCSKGTGFFSCWQSSWHMMLTSHLQLELRLRMSGVLLILPAVCVRSSANSVRDYGCWRDSSMVYGGFIWLKIGTGAGHLCTCGNEWHFLAAWGPLSLARVTLAYEFSN